ncbi:Glucokinase [Taphrina deformans PYCC 5710]|uniref:Phosphotransferase n=1 Tax=Taphrina deformans (strain PYCC 5710 / ATCC 11124 / CBS 356.35 / IMI 108563 / JCM 9778 / NBRC 8474) TaxID=1097556 RepID=R4XDN6_TAPDE|nr:Glucokinase [Taphrina deformans PYCC 5710]|eukprot:CCG81454.1 Glucokinase [Taphrina deformans PYCC 5710]
MSLDLSEAATIADKFSYSAQSLKLAVEHFQTLAEDGLKKDDQSMTMIPTYVTEVPTGRETGTYLALDLGGTNLRVCSITLHGDGTFDNRQVKYPVSKELQRASNHEDLFGYIAEKVEGFVRQHHEDAFSFTQPEHFLRLGFTFSFPVVQTAIDQGILLRWTKGFDIHSAVGQDVVWLLQSQLDKRSVPVKVVALVNDTVGTLMARSYGSPEVGQAAMGAIFGTGTNGAYIENLKKIEKLKFNAAIAGKADRMVINTEWGSFDNALKVLPSTTYDEALDKITPNPGIQMFEKRISGMFLGEILRQTLIVHFPHSKVTEAWSLDTAVMSDICLDNSNDRAAIGEILESILGIEDTKTNREALRLITFAIGRRAARLSAIPIAALAISTGGLENGKTYNIGVDGSVVEFYPQFELMLREALAEILGKSNEERFIIGVAKDGSGVGAALVALSTVLQDQHDVRV